MNEKHMHIKKIVVPTLTMAIIASQLLGCGAMSQSDLLKMINKYIKNNKTGYSSSKDTMVK